MRDTPGLPMVLQMIAEALSPGRALATASEVGGQRWFVPRFPHGKSALAQRIGLDVTLVLADCYGGEYVDFPVAAAVTAAQVRRAILTGNGSANDLAKDNGITRRRVFQIKAGAGRPANPDQTSLFED